MKTLKFKGFKADRILSGEKTASMRLFDDKDLRVGDDLELVNSDTEEIFAHAVVTEIVEKNLGDVNDIDLMGHEKWSGKEEMFQTLRTYYGNRVNDKTLVKIVHFKLK